MGYSKTKTLCYYCQVAMIWGYLCDERSLSVAYTIPHHIVQASVTVEVFQAFGLWFRNLILMSINYLFSNTTKNRFHHCFAISSIYGKEGGNYETLFHRSYFDEASPYCKSWTNTRVHSMWFLLHNRTFLVMILLYTQL